MHLISQTVPGAERHRKWACQSLVWMLQWEPDHTSFHTTITMCDSLEKIVLVQKIKEALFNSVIFTFYVKTLWCPIGSLKNIFFQANYFHKMKKSNWFVKAFRVPEPLKVLFILAFLSSIGSICYPSRGAVYLVQQSALAHTENNCTQITFHTNLEAVCLWCEVHPTFIWASCLLAPVLCSDWSQQICLFRAAWSNTALSRCDF